MPYMRQGSPTTKAISPYSAKTIKLGGTATFSGSGAGALSPLSSQSNQFNSDMSAITDAMKLTQTRASADRDAALNELRSAKTSSLNLYSQLPDEMLNQNVRDQMYNEGREVAEAERQSMLRQAQRSFGGGGVPSGAALEAAQNIDMAKMGTLAQLKRKIGTESAEKNWMSRFNKAGAVSGIEMGTAEKLASVLGNTIAAVPELPSKPANTPAAQKVDNTFGRLPGEMNVDFMKRNPEGYNAWYNSQYGSKRSYIVGSGGGLGGYSSKASRPIMMT